MTPPVCDGDTSSGGVASATDRTTGVFSVRIGNITSGFRSQRVVADDNSEGFSPDRNG